LYRHREIVKSKFGMSIRAVVYRLYQDMITG